MTERFEIALRLACFGGVLLVMALWELRAPRRPLTVRKAPRWASNLGLVAMNVVLARLLVPVTAVDAALAAESRGWGLLHLVDWPALLEIVLAVLAFDLAIYLQHVMFHAAPALWRLHMVHHSDLDFDVTTGLRFHTLEILLSAIIKLAFVAVVGPAALAVIIFEVLLNATSMFNHGNVQLPGWLDRLLRWFLVTPEMHRVHHSVIRAETNSNFGFSLPWWDFLLGTYRSQPSAGHEKMTVGVACLSDERQVDRLRGMLLLPFRANPGPYPINQQNGQAPIGDPRMTPDSGFSPSEATDAMSQQTPNPMDRLAGEYDQWFDSPEGKALFELELDCVRDVKGSEPRRWLEVGVGTGRFAAALGIREGTDPSEPALVLARSRGIDVIRGAAEKLPYQDETFDGILLAATLCFVADPSAAMAECRRALKPGGRVVIGIVPVNSPWGRLYAEKGRQGHPFYSTAHFHTAGEVISLAENAGLAFTSACSCLLNPPNSPQEKRVEKQVVESAGFVCLGFCKQ